MGIIVNGDYRQWGLSSWGLSWLIPQNDVQLVQHYFQ
jgi:hypothetical protein